MKAADADVHLRETLLASEQVFRGHFLDLRRDRVRLPNGETAQREYIVHPGAVMVVPILDDGRLVVEHQFRYPMARVMLEFPAGKLDAGEAPLQCAIRELVKRPATAPVNGPAPAFCTTRLPIQPKASRCGLRAA